MSLAAAVRGFRAKAMDQTTEIIVTTAREFAGSLVDEWTPYGQPELWKAPPPADYRPGNLQSSWFLSTGAPSGEKTTSTTHREVHHLERLSSFKLGEKIYLSNSAPHAGAIETGHSSQAPNGIMVNAMEFPAIAYSVTRRLAR